MTALQCFHRSLQTLSSLGVSLSFFCHLRILISDWGLLSWLGERLVAHGIHFIQTGGMRVSGTGIKSGVGCSRMMLTPDAAVLQKSKLREYRRTVVLGPVSYFSPFHVIHASVSLPKHAVKK